MLWNMLSPVTWALLAVLLWAIIFLAIFSRRARRQNDEAARKFLHEEEVANRVKKRPLEDELFYTPELDKLPPLPEGDPQQVQRAASRKMIRFNEPMTNVEIKLRYGRHQLEQLAHYEENYFDYLRILTKWGEALLKDNKKADAARILEHAVALGSEFRRSYKFLADIYAGNNDPVKLEELLAKAEFKKFRDPAVAQHIMAYIREKQAEVRA